MWGGGGGLRWKPFGERDMRAELLASESDSSSSSGVGGGGDIGVRTCG